MDWEAKWVLTISLPDGGEGEEQVSPCLGKCRAWQLVVVQTCFVKDRSCHPVVSAAHPCLMQDQGFQLMGNLCPPVGGLPYKRHVTVLLVTNDSGWEVGSSIGH